MQHKQNQMKEVLTSVSKALEGVKEKRKEHDHKPLIVINGISSVFKADHVDVTAVLMEWAFDIAKKDLGTVVVMSDVAAAAELEEDVNNAGHMRIVSLDDENFEHTVAHIEKR